MTKGIIAQAAQLLEQADAVLVTASNGLSISEGYHIFADNDDFRKYFGEFRTKYGVDCLIRGVFTPMTQADRTRYMKTVHKYLIEDYHGSDVMRKLLARLESKKYFVVTSNADTHFQMNGFDPGRIFEVEGNFDGLQEGSPAWKAQQRRFVSFLRENKDRSLLVLELGIGARNQLIKAPVMQMVDDHPAWHYVTVNLPQEINIPDSIRDRSLAVPGNIAELL